MPHTNKRMGDRNNKITPEMQELINEAVAKALKENSITNKSKKLVLSGVKKGNEFIEFAGEKGEKATEFIKGNLNKGKENTKGFFKSLGKAGLNRLKAIGRPVVEKAKSIKKGFDSIKDEVKEGYKETKADLQYAAEQEQLKSEIVNDPDFVYPDPKNNRKISAYHVENGEKIEGKNQTESHILKYTVDEKETFYKLQGPLQDFMKGKTMEQMGKFLIGKVEGKDQERNSMGKVDRMSEEARSGILKGEVEKQDFNKEDISKMSKFKAGVKKAGRGIMNLMAEKSESVQEK
jgi:hypothetical protein